MRVRRASKGDSYRDTLLAAAASFVIASGIGDEFEIVLTTNADGLDVMTVRVEHHAGATVGATVVEEIRTRCEVRAGVEVLTPGTLPRTEFKAARANDRREKRR